MSYSYEYDESGVASSYLGLSIVIPVAMYYTYRILTETRVRRVECSCVGCSRNVGGRQVWNKVIATVLWVVVSYLMHNIKTLKIEKGKGFDPLEVLGIEHNTGMQEVKKRLRTLLMKYNVHKVDGELRKEYEEKQKMINKAYNLVSNKERYETWLNNESKSGEIIAIPQIVVRRGGLAFLVYSIVLGVFLPRWAYRRWKRMHERNRVGVHFKTMEMFYEKIDRRMNQIKCAQEASVKLISVMSKCVEFEEYKWRSNVEGLKMQIEGSFGYPLQDGAGENKGYLVLMDHLFRVGQAEDRDREYVQRTSLVLIEGMKAIAVAKRYGGVMKHLMTVRAMIMQGVFDPKYSLLQIPFVSFEDLFVQERSKKMQVGERYLSGALGGRELECAMNVYSQMPRVEVSEFNACVINTGSEVDGDVQEEDENDVTMRQQSEGSKTKRGEQVSYIVPEKCMATVRVVLNKVYVRPEMGKRGDVMVVHSPYMSGWFSVRWMVMLTIDEAICGKVQMVEDFVDRKVVKFSVDVSGLKKVSECKVFVGNGEYLDSGVEKSIIIKVE